MRRSPTLEGLDVSSQGRRLFGGLYLAGGSGPAPAAVLLHGLPGHEQNLDLAQRLRALGISVAFFHYRGSWGSEGSYALNHALPDARAVVAWMLDRPDVDPERLAVIGLSFGGWVGFQMAADEPRIRCLVAISPLIDPLDPTGRLTPELATTFAAPLAGVHAEQLMAEWQELPSVLTRAEALTSRPVLLVTAEADEIFPPRHYTRLRERLPGLEHVQFPRADHVYSSVRPGLCHVIGDWLTRQLEPRAGEGSG
jgi:pimeloyl-ACP methyl ester carboxylesterase